MVAIPSQAMESEYYRNVKDCTVVFDIGLKCDLGKLIDCIEELTGYDTVLAVVPINGSYEVSMMNGECVSQIIGERSRI
ncbi:hypothetical protein SNE40_020543 [Patella caerulea]|uniref:Uncharacterized protein n=1 Tax=Patella caerulea TaxID=87958 RepID=A0AAN8IYP4_PATCE